jgi:tetratricopeptide (TPR) repeat protein
MNAPLQFSGVSAEHPFPGLRPFAYQDHEYFFGREEQTYALYRLIDRFHFIAVVGSSGSGKSSLVRAGLLPLLDTETREAGGRNWLWREMRPGDAPLQRLTGLLASLSIDDDPIVASGRRERIAAQLQRSSFGVSEALAETNGVTDKSLVLVIDQFEELFRYAAAASGKTGPSGDEVRARDEATQFVQLLLEASRAPSITIHVMLTMRSDFIGDCARFHGLPEAVCAAQFLVPSLTRDQLDEVIRKPVEKAGASIDPELVERLLNDCGTEMDQLPVLQHCLSRLWEEAGEAPAAIPTPFGAAPVENATSTARGSRRHLSLNHYRNIGEFADALSRHADEILKDLPGPTLQLAVKQAFSALSELDKEGRAIRRALRFSQLVAETGVDEPAVRQVLDRFRAGDCSFLTPSPFEVKEISDETRIDVGHEALLRRWDKVSGRGAELGWLRAEQQAGERYRGLLAMAEGDDAALPLHLVDERLAWWKARPRTPAWAERYGGGFSRVQRLLQVSQLRRRVRRWAIAAAFIIVVGVAGSMAWLWQMAEHSRKEANTSRINALTTTKISVGRLVGFLNDGTLSAKNAEQFLDDAKVTLDDLAKTENHSLEISEIEVLLLLSFSDVRVALGKYDDALKRAERAVAISERLVKQYPDNPDVKRHLFAGRFRIGDEKARTGNNKEAEEQYDIALDTAQQMASSNPTNIDRQRDVAFVLNKIGDLNKDKKDWKTAIEKYNAGLEIAETVRDKFPGDIATQKNRIAQVLSERGEQGDAVEALAKYREALAIQTQLLSKSPDNATLLSNVALTHRRIGGLLKDRPNEARVEYEAAVANRKTLYEGDPGNVLWRTGLATDYTLLGDMLMQTEDFRGASQSYNAAIRIEEGLILKDPGNIRWQRDFAIANLKRGDALIHRGDEALVRPEPVLNESSRLIDDALVRYRIAAETFAKMADNPKAGAARYSSLIDVWIRIGDVLVRQNNYKDAMDAYQSALAASEQAAPTQRVVDWQIKISVALEQAGDALAPRTREGTTAYRVASTAGGSALDYYQKALEVVEAAAIKEANNQEVQSRKAAITKKIETQRSTVQ